MTRQEASKQRVVHHIMRAPLEELRTGYYCIHCGRELIYTHHMPEEEQDRRIKLYEEYMINVEGDVEALHYVYIWGCVEHGAAHEHCEVNFHLERDNEMPRLSENAPYHVILSYLVASDGNAP